MRCAKKGRSAYNISVRKLLGNRQLRRHHRWKDNIKMNFQEIKHEDLNWVYQI
jgi:hypothetical protein